MLDCDVLLLQEHWLSAGQLGDIDCNIMYTGVSGFDDESVLSGRPYGGCAILWHSNICAHVAPINVDSRRICAVSPSQ